MNFYELALLIENEESNIILRSVLNYPNVYIEKDPKFHGEEATWDYLNSRLEVKIIIYKDYLENSHKNLTTQEFHKNFFHPDFGVIPHELLEGELTGLIMQERFEEIPFKFKASFNHYWNDFNRLFKKYEFDKNAINNNERAYNEFGGYVHEVIVNSTPGYDAWGNYVYDKIFKKAVFEL